ncbi:hypothetical protein ACIHDR_11500 [Nocardia sp. NPDC052278]|uniref:hypothetical protein n=1 Tax=unclassified Nocardia TaxID=2637762 RepID=UPI0036A8035B
MADMPPLLVPDPESSRWPKDIASLKISPQIEKWYDVDLLNVITKDWNVFGNGEVTDIPSAGAVPQVTLMAARSQMFDAYVQKVNSLKADFDALQSTYKEVAQAVANAKKYRLQDQGQVGDLIANLSNSAATPPPQPEMTEDEHIMDYVSQGLKQAENIMGQASQKQQGVADEINALTKEVQDRDAQIKTLQDASVKPQQQLSGDSYDPTNVNPLPTDFTDSTPSDLGAETNDSSLTDGSLSGEPTVARGTTTPSTATPISTSPDTASGLGASGLASGSGLSDLMGSILPMIMAQQMQRGLADPDVNDQRDQRDPYGYGYSSYSPSMPPSAATTPPAQTTQPAASSPAAQQSTTAPQQQGPALTTRTPDGDGLVDYTFPDGRTQKVSPVVAQALDAAFGDQSRTDAQAAYSKTTAKWSDKKQIDDRVDPYQLKTGDIATWENRAALVVMFETSDNDSGSVEVIVDGQLQQFAGQMSDKAGDFGQFTGFAHPKGVDAQVAQDAAAAAVPASTSTGGVSLLGWS